MLGYRVGGGSGQNIVELGSLARCDQGHCLTLRRFEGRLNLPRTPLTKYVHHMAAPFRSLTCSDQPLHEIKGALMSPVVTGLAQSGDELIVRTEQHAYVWRVDSKLGHGYILSRLKGAFRGQEPDQAVGFAFSGQAPTSALTPDQFQQRYKGDIFHKNIFKAPQNDWESMSSALSISRFTYSAPLFLLTQPGNAEVVKRKKRQVWSHNSILLIPDADTAHLVQEYGHDFNMNGCFDEQGHNKLLLPVMRKGKIVDMVYLEYTPDARDGVPMMSVGRYYSSVTKNSPHSVKEP